jgi:pimeloyl-ACP methyl ester carboxylesterase
LPTKYAYVDGTAVHYMHGGRSTLPGVVPDLGRGELLAFLHDAGGNAGIWRNAAALIDQTHSTIAFDFPGHGRSGGTESPKTVEAYAGFFITLARALGMRPAILVGHGMGAAVALETVLAAPDLVRALVLANATTHFEAAPEMLRTWQNVMRGRAPQPFTTDAFSPQTDFAVMRQGWTEQVQTDPRVRYFDLVAWSRYDAAPRLGEIRVPTIVVAGADDRITPPAQAEQLQHGIAGADLVVVADAGHLLPLEKPAELAKAIGLIGPIS